MCVDPNNIEYYNCDALRQESRAFGEVSSCEFTSCEGNNCNKLSIESDVQCDYTFQEGGMCVHFNAMVIMLKTHNCVNRFEFIIRKTFPMDKSNSHFS